MSRSLPGQLLPCAVRLLSYSKSAMCRGVRYCSASAFEATRITQQLLDSHTVAMLEKYSRYTPAPISIQKLLDHGRKSDTGGSYLFLRHEIPTRLANMIMELKLLPSTLMHQRECSDIYQDYIRSFREAIEYEKMPNLPDTHVRFTETLSHIRRRHVDTVPQMAQAVQRMNRLSNMQDGVSDTIQYFLDRLYTSRISIHMLISHYQSLHGIQASVEGLVGTIDPECNILAIADQAYSAASLLCDNEYFDHPKLVSSGVDTTATDPGPVTCVYVPAHLHHILFEVFKNAMRASCEYAERKELADIPHIRLLVFKTEDDITLKISDRGGGIPRRRRGKIFNYMYSTAPKIFEDTSLSSGSTGTEVKPVEGPGSFGIGLSSDALPMHGLGYGLPLSRLYARYFKGDIKIGSVHGHGTDVYVYLQRLSSLAQENLPIFNAVSSARLTNTATQASDWTDNDKFL